MVHLEKHGVFPSVRLGLAIICFIGCILIYSLRSNLSFAIVCMVNSTWVEEQSISDGVTTLHKKSECTPHENDTYIEKEKIVGEFQWHKNIQGGVLSAFFWGYISSQVLAGYLATRYGARLIIGINLLGGGIITLLSPLAASVNVYSFLGLRAALGFVQGSTYPGIHHLWSLWAPPFERSLLTGISYAGAQIANVVVLPVSGLLCKYGPLGGWPSIFYIFGALTLIWGIFWLYFVADTPQKHRTISEKERTYIIESLRESRGKNTDHSKHQKVPWTSILTSMPVWACFVGQFAGDWGGYMMWMSLPSYMNDVLGFELTTMGFVTSIPYLVDFFVINLSGYVADKLIESKSLSVLNVRRLAMLIAFGFQALFLVLTGYCGCGQEWLVIVFLTLSVAISGLQYPGVYVNFLDIAPNFAGPVLGIGNTLSCFAGILAPLMMGWMTPTGSKEEWRMVFYVTGAILIFGAVFFSIFASGDVQPWALSQDNLPKAIEEPLLSDSKKAKNGHTVEESPNL